MLKQILVMSNKGPCYLSKNYTEQPKDIDPQLISALISTNSNKVSLSTITNILKEELNDDDSFAMEINKTYNYITAAISTSHSDSKSIRKILPKINKMVYEILGDSNKVVMIGKDKMDKMEHGIDLIMINEGLIGS